MAKDKRHMIKVLFLEPVKLVLQSLTTLMYTRVINMIFLFSNESSKGVRPIILRTETHRDSSRSSAIRKLFLAPKNKDLWCPLSSLAISISKQSERRALDKICICFAACARGTN